MKTCRNNHEAGYWLLEPAPLTDLMSATGDRSFSRAVLEWVGEEVERSLELNGRGVHLKVIEVVYVAPHACPAAWSETGDFPADLEVRVEEAVTELLKRITAGDAIGRIVRGTAEPATVAA